MIIYNEFYNILEQYIFGTITKGSYQELVAILVSTIASLFVVALPIVLVWKVMGSIFRWFN